MTFFDRFMLSFLFGYTVGSLLISTIKADIRRREAEKHIKYLGTKKLTDEEAKELFKMLGLEKPEEDGEEDGEEDE